MNGPMLANQINPREIFSDKDGRYRCEFFVYNADFALTATAGFTIPVTVQTQVDADFVWQMGTYNLFTAAAADETVTAANVEIPDARVQILDSATGKNLFFAPMEIQALFSNTAQFPTMLPVAREFKGGSSLTLTVTSVKTWAAAYNLQLALIGHKKIRDVG